MKGYINNNVRFTDILSIGMIWINNRVFKLEVTACISDRTKINEMVKYTQDFLKQWLEIILQVNMDFAVEEAAKILRAGFSSPASFDGTVALPGGVELRLVRIEPGSFTNTEINKTFRLRNAYWLGETEVTQGQYASVMKGVKNEVGKECDPRPSRSNGNDYFPVEQVSWHDAKAFCGELNRRYGGMLPKGYRFDLPTESQWEYAARGGRRTKGYEYSGGSRMDGIGWYYENSGRSRLDDGNRDVEKLAPNGCQTHPVGKKGANELGLYDMSGNVWEWCRDVYSNNWAEDHEFLRGQRDDDGSDRVSRGGAWSRSARLCRSALRSFSDPSNRNYGLGFRVALVPVQ